MWDQFKNGTNFKNQCQKALKLTEIIYEIRLNLNAFPTVSAHFRWLLEFNAWNIEIIAHLIPF